MVLDGSDVCFHFPTIARIPWVTNSFRSDGVSCGTGAGSKQSSARNEAARYVLIHWGYIGPDW